MAEEVKAPKVVTWKEKIERGERLNPLEEVQADADYIVRKRIRDDKERAEFEAAKQGLQGAPGYTGPYEETSQLDNVDEEELNKTFVKPGPEQPEEKKASEKGSK